MIDKLKSADSGMTPSDQMRAAVGLIALAGMLLPWIKLDGYSEAMNGGELIAYALTSPERASIFSASKLGATAVLLLPVLSLAANIYGFFRLMQGRHSLGAHLSGTLCPLGMVVLAGTVASSDGPSLLGITIPGIGVIVTMLAQGTLFIDAMVEGRD